jgi:hypothetical protein
VEQDSEAVEEKTATFVKQSEAVEQQIISTKQHSGTLENGLPNSG